MKRNCASCYFEAKGYCNFHYVKVDDLNSCDNHAFTTELCSICENLINDCDCEPCDCCGDHLEDCICGN